MNIPRFVCTAALVAGVLVAPPARGDDDKKDDSARNKPSTQEAKSFEKEVMVKVKLNYLGLTRS